ncbi:uncharacterized protein LOC135710012 [Ochlerotatus camptorhynchus]|uniref:uncharacterized protein LOC135710012 n=1 Tax=Ochlerotatus camptorhynchus TaxID=644619 RepID=UPI0031D7B96E
MVRHCAVRGCNNTDMSTLCHRFPKRKDAFEQWQRSLQLDDAEATLLMQRFVVCTLHFKTSDYRNSTSRMLNTVAIPTLSINNKAAFYDAPTSAVGIVCSSTGNAGGSSNVRTCSNSTKKPVEEFMPKIESPKSDDQEGILISSSLIIERVEPPEAVVEVESEEDMIYFIEEEVPPTETTEADPDVENRLRESSPIESSKAKRFKLESWEIDAELNEQPDTIEEIPIALQPAIEYRNSLVQTDDIEIVSHEDQLHRRMVDECYPEYAGYSRLDFAKQLKEKDDRLAELTKKLSNFETAHAAMMKTMEAFKTLVN